MLTNANRNQDTQGSPLNGVLPGEPVYDTNGDKVGVVSEEGAQGNYFIVHKGIIFTRDLYVPLTAVSHSDADGVYLNLTKDEINNQDSDNPPAEGVNTETPYAPAGSEPAYGQGPDKGTDSAATWTQPAQRDAAQAGDVTLPVREEELAARRWPRQAGDVRLRKEVTEEQQTLNVPVTHEEVRVERVPVDDRQSAGDVEPDAFTEKDVDVPLMGEQVNVEKQARVGEEVRLHKQPVTEERQVSGTVRKEHLRVDGAEDEAMTPYDTPDQPTRVDPRQP